MDLEFHSSRPAFQRSCRKGRFQVHPDIPTWVQRSMSALQLTEVPLTIDVALAIPSIPFQHGDPADQFLAASAKVSEATLITADENLMHLPGIRVLANR